MVFVLRIASASPSPSRSATVMLNCLIFEWEVLIVKASVTSSVLPSENVAMALVSPIPSPSRSPAVTVMDVRCLELASLFDFSTSTLLRILKASAPNIIFLFADEVLISEVMSFVEPSEKLPCAFNDSNSPSPSRSASRRIKFLMFEWELLIAVFSFE